MKGINEKQLNDYLELRDLRVNNRFLGGRIFRGQIRGVNFSPAVPGIYMVQVNRTEDQASGATDLTRYSCSIPGYIPRVGDYVDLLWRSKNEAVVLDPVGAGRTPTIAAVTAMTSISLVSGSSDWSGQVIYTPTGAVAAGAVLFTVTFSAPFPLVPFVIVVQARGGTEGVVQAYSNGTTATSFQAVALGAHTAATTYVVNYMVAR